MCLLLILYIGLKFATASELMPHGTWMLTVSLLLSILTQSAGIY